MFYPLISLVFCLILIIILVRVKCDLGISLILGSIVLGLLLHLSIGKTFYSIWQSIIDIETLYLIAVILLIQYFGDLAGKLGYLTRFVNGLQRLFTDNRLILAIIPAVGGLLPMPGGAMLTAPMVETVAKNTSLTPEQKTFYNYWFRHVWEYILPLYPGVILSSVIFKIPLRQIIYSLFPLTISAISAGLIYIYATSHAGKNEIHSKKEQLFGFVQISHGIWPILIIVASVLLFKQDLLITLLIITPILMLINRIGFKLIWNTAKETVSYSTITLVVGVMAFKWMLEVTAIVKVIPAFLASINFLPILIIFLVPFFIGLITGVTQAFVGVAFPVIIPFLITSGTDLNITYVMLAYAGGFIGVLLSPVHLCLILTNEYFKADLIKTYRQLIIPIIAVTLIAFILVAVRK
jgi:integral membrane protein (TIGR00529 family)